MCQQACKTSCVPCRRAKNEALEAKVQEQDREIQRLRGLLAQRSRPRSFSERLTYLLVGR